MAFEPLESRRLYAAATLTHHVLTVTATAGVSNTITVGLSPDATAIVTTVAYTTGRGTRATPHTVTNTFPLSAGITTVKVYGSNKADTITVDPTNGTIPASVQIRAGGGNDTVTGGDEPDAIWGQGGNDLLIGGGGNDSLYGMAGSDTLIGGDGDDYLSGGAGHDSLEGDAGNDTLYDPFGPDTIMGGAGDNTFRIASLRRDPTNDYNDVKDTLHIIPVPATSSDSGPSVGDILGGLLPFL